MQLRLSTSPILDSWYIPDAMAKLTTMLPDPKMSTIDALAKNPKDWLPRRANALVLELVGWTPSKKNKLRPAPGKGFAYKRGVKAAMTALLTQARAQWGPRLRLGNHPNVEIWMQVKDDLQDKDGIVTTIIDVLKKAAIIEDDSIRYFNGVMIVYQATIGEPWVKVRLNWRDGEAEHYDG